jgi:lipopolysaccharide heptosyltransferase I
MRILIVKLSSLGDLFHALPAVHAVRVGLGAEIHWVTQTSYVELVRRFTDVERVIGFPRRGGAAERWRFLRALRQSRYDLVLDLQGLLKSAVVARLARGDRRIGPSYHREGARAFYAAVAGPHRPERHAVEQALDVVRYLGLDPGPACFPTAFEAPDPGGDRPRIALVPCSRWATKNWPVDRFIAVGRALRAAVGGTQFVIGGPGDEAVCRELAAAVPGAVNTCGTTSLPAMAGLLGGMDLAITVDTGPMHVAAAQGVPVLAVFGATDPVRTGPYGPGHRVLHADDLACRPCRARTCRRGDLACLHRVDPATVIRHAREMLQGRAGRPG